MKVKLGLLLCILLLLVACSEADLPAVGYGAFGVAADASTPKQVSAEDILFPSPRRMVYKTVESFNRASDLDVFVINKKNEITMVPIQDVEIKISDANGAKPVEVDDEYQFMYEGTAWVDLSYQNLKARYSVLIIDNEGEISTGGSGDDGGFVIKYPDKPKTPTDTQDAAESPSE
jgi:hypothetical protein